MLEKKYVFHIPIFKYINGELVEIGIDGVLDDLIGLFAEQGFDSLYITNVKSIYKSRIFDELTLTLFSSGDDFPEAIFMEWFKDYNDVLCQEEFSYECNNRMFIERLD